MDDDGRLVGGDGRGDVMPFGSNEVVVVEESEFR